MIYIDNDHYSSLKYDPTNSTLITTELLEKLRITKEYKRELVPECNLLIVHIGCTSRPMFSISSSCSQLVAGEWKTESSEVMLAA